PGGFHLWLPLPEPWREGEFVAAARARGVAVAPAEVFAVGRQPTPPAVRVCVSAQPDRESLAQGLDVLAGLLAQPPSAPLLM
ncbi:MAG TPA: PLP-dependent aminotransferase family protein, partial [Plasticicumulans sp.]|nr:PLP-dependent aminotransferase family protein [Plasticicumulans sp.]